MANEQSAELEKRPIILIKQWQQNRRARPEKTQNTVDKTESANRRESRDGGVSPKKQASAAAVPTAPRKAKHAIGVPEADEAEVRQWGTRCALRGPPCVRRLVWTKVPPGGPPRFPRGNITKNYFFCKSQQQLLQPATFRNFFQYHSH
jgi:hypothetical protein